MQNQSGRQDSDVRALTSNELRTIDQVAMTEYGISGLVLMENAGRSAAEIIHRLYPGRSVAFLCGKGNNAGDGFVIARHLELLGHSVHLLMLHDAGELSPDAAANHQIARAAGIPMSRLPSQEANDGKAFSQFMSRFEIVADCLLGTGTQGPLRQPYADCVAAANRATAVRIAMDLPSGMNPDTGLVEGAVFRADHTITFVAPSIGMLQNEGPTVCGTVHRASIGLPLGFLRKRSLISS